MSNFKNINKLDKKYVSKFKKVVILEIVTQLLIIFVMIKLPETSVFYMRFVYFVLGSLSFSAFKLYEKAYIEFTNMLDNIE